MFVTQKLVYGSFFHAKVRIKYHKMTIKCFWIGISKELEICFLCFYQVFINICDCYDSCKEFLVQMMSKKYQFILKLYFWALELANISFNCKINSKWPRWPKSQMAQTAVWLLCHLGLGKFFFEIFFLFQLPYNISKRIQIAKKSD